MPAFSVWAPNATEVALDRNGQRVPMTATHGGWWQAPPPPCPGDRYGYSLDGGPVRPDPRSAHQPDGVDGRSMIVDHGAFEWTDATWRGLHVPGAVLYELHVGTFSPEGTFDGVAGRLGHLLDLGVDAVELMPVATFPGVRGWGYDGVALYAPHPAYGGPDGLKRLVDSCHRAGVAVILDVVYNHLGPAGNYLREFGPYFSSVHRTNWGDGVNLDGPGSDEVRRFFIDNARAWLRDYHVDGLRLDAVHALTDRSAVHFLEQLAGEVRALGAHLGRSLALIAETDLNDPKFVRSERDGGYGLDAAWADEWHHAWHAAFTSETVGYYEDFGELGQLAKALRQAWVYDGEWSPHRRRTFGRPPEGLTGDRFVVFTQNHDQVGNRAAGDRSSALISTDRIKVSAGLLLTAPFVPMLFHGEEWGAGTPWQYFTDFGDPALGRAVTEGRRSEFSGFGWRQEDVPDPQDPATFERSKLDWSEPGRAPHADILDWHRQLIALRRQRADLTDGRLDRVAVYSDPACKGLIVERPETLVVALIGPDPACVEVGPGRLLAASRPDVAFERGRLAMVPDSLAVVSRAAGSPPPPFRWAFV